MAEPALLQQACMVQQAVAWGTSVAQGSHKGGPSSSSSIVQQAQEHANDTSIFLALLAQEMVAEQMTAAAEAGRLYEGNSC